MVNYSKELMEPYALDVLTASYNKAYAKYKKFDLNGFDYESANRKKVLEITIAISDGEKSLLEYEKAYAKNGKAQISKVKNPLTIDGQLYGIHGSTEEILKSIVTSIKIKEKKRKKKENSKIKCYELCVLCPLGYMIGVNNLDIVKELIEKDLCNFHKVFLVTSDYVYIINKKRIRVVGKKFSGNY